MIVLCAWCEQEGKQALLGDTGSLDRSRQSHGICETHHNMLLRKIDQLKKKSPIRHIPRHLSLPNARGNAQMTVMYL